jgi:hypothetical protein
MKAFSCCEYSQKFSLSTSIAFSERVEEIDGIEDNSQCVCYGLYLIGVDSFVIGDKLVNVFHSCTESFEREEWFSVFADCDRAQLSRPGVDILKEV